RHPGRDRRGARPAHLQGRGVRLRHQVEHPAQPGRRGVRRPGGAGLNAGARGAGGEAGRRLPVQRTGRSRRRGGGARESRAAPGGGAGVWALPPAPDPRAGARRQDLEAQVRAPRRQPAGAGSHHRQGRDHVAEPRLRRRHGLAGRPPRRDPRQPERSHRGGIVGEGAADVRGAVPSRGVARAARRALSLPPLRRDDGAASLMPKRTDIRSILLIGSGPIVIGQACEFDYSGTQACKALKEEGYRVVLANSNPATIMTDPEFADRTYVEPLTVEVLSRIIEAERPDALLPTIGGQTGLNLALDLANAGVLERWGVELIGAKVDAIKRAEDRDLFKETMRSIGLDLRRR